MGPLRARLLIAGLAPGLKGANRTGRPFTGGFAGDLLYSTLLKFGFARGTYGRAADDGLRLVDCRITNAVRCAPPQNKPLGAEIAACRPYLESEIGRMPELRVILALGGIAHLAVLRSQGQKGSAHKFAHRARHQLIPTGHKNDPLDVPSNAGRAPPRPWLPRAGSGAQSRLPEGGETSSSPSGIRPLALIDSYHCSRLNTNTGRLTEAMFHNVFDDIRGLLEEAAPAAAR